MAVGKDCGVLAAWGNALGGAKLTSGSAAICGSRSTGGYRRRITWIRRRLWRGSRSQAAALVAGRGQIVAEFFDVGQSRTLAWARRPQAAALVAGLADPDRGWDAIVIGE